MRIPLGWDVHNAVNAVPPPGGIFWSGDEWTYKNGFYVADALTLMLNAISALVGAGSKRIYVSNSTYYGTDFKAALSGEGHTVTTASSTIVPSTDDYDFLILYLHSGISGDAAAADASLWSFIQAGGGVYECMGQSGGEGTTMADLLANCGIVYSTPYVLTGDVVPESGPSFFDGVGSVYMAGAGQFSLDAPATGVNARWQGTIDPDTYYVFAAWADSVKW